MWLRYQRGESRGPWKSQTFHGESFYALWVLHRVHPLLIKMSNIFQKVRDPQVCVQALKHPSASHVGRHRMQVINGHSEEHRQPELKDSPYWTVWFGEIESELWFDFLPTPKTHDTILETHTNKFISKINLQVQFWLFNTHTTLIGIIYYSFNETLWGRSICVFIAYLKRNVHL